MALNWNPNSPRVKGVEVDTVGYSHRVVDASHDVAATRMTAKHTGAITAFQLHSGPGSAAPILSGRFNELRTPCMLELVAAGNEDTEGATHTDYAVSTITGTASMYNENMTKPVTTSRVAVAQDGLHILATKRAAYVVMNFATSAFPLDRHVLAVELRLRHNLTAGVRRIDPAAEQWFYNIPMFSPSAKLSSVRWGEAIVDGAASAWSHWTPAKVREFATTRFVRISCQAGPGAWRLDLVQLRIHHIAERRRGVGFGSPSAPYMWVNFPMTTPNATGAPAVTTGEQLTLMCRRITDYTPDVVGARTVMPLRYLRGRAPTSDWQQRQQPWVAWASGFENIGVQIDGIPAIRALNGVSVVATSQPYQLNRGIHVYGGLVARQRLSLPSGTVYGQAYVVCGWKQSGGRPTGALSVKVIHQPTGVVVWSATEVTPAGWVAQGSGFRLSGVSGMFTDDDQGVRYKRVRIRFPESINPTAGLYEVQVSSPNSGEERPWYVAALIGSEHAVDATHGGETEFASGLMTLSGTPTEVAPTGPWSADALITMAAVPPAVTGVSTATGSWSAHDAMICSCADTDDGATGCASDTLPFIRLSWSRAPATTPSTEGYNVERLDAHLGAEWEPVAYVDGVHVTSWDDHEPGIGVVSQYRVQVVQSDGLTGDWSTPVSQFLAPGQVALSFSSNAATGMGCVYPEVWERDEVIRDRSFTEFDAVELRRFHGRNMPVAFRSLERSGETFRRTLLLSAGCVVARPSRDVFRPLRDLAYAPVPYVCIRDGEGNRWYTSLLVPDGVNRRADDAGNELWLADIQATEVSDVPFPVDTHVAQVTEPAQP